MTDGIEAITTQALGLALDAASLRQQAIAANIANAEVPGHVPVAVDFEAQLDDARRAFESGGMLDAASLAGVVPRIAASTETGALGLSPQVMLDVEAAHLAQNAVHYQAPVKGLARHYAILSTAVSDGKK